MTEPPQLSLRTVQCLIGSFASVESSRGLPPTKASALAELRVYHDALVKYKRDAAKKSKPIPS